MTPGLYEAVVPGPEPHINGEALNAFLHGVMLSHGTREELTVTDPCVAVWEAELALSSLEVMPGVSGGLVQDSSTFGEPDLKQRPKRKAFLCCGTDAA